MNDSPRWTRDPGDLDGKLRTLVPGKRYMFIWTNDSRRTDRMSVLKFLGHNDLGGPNWSLDLDARPDAGTQNLEAKWILRVQHAAQDAKIRIDEKAPVPPQEPGPDDSGTEEPQWQMYRQHCGRRDEHGEHVLRMSAQKRWKLMCPGELSDLTQSADVGVRWQAQMEDHLAQVRGLSHEVMRLLSSPGTIQDERVKFSVRQRTELTKAHASAALALAISNGVSDLEPVLSLLSQPIRYMTTEAQQ